MLNYQQLEYGRIDDVVGIGIHGLEFRIRFFSILLPFQIAL